MNDAHGYQVELDEIVEVATESLQALYRQTDCVRPSPEDVRLEAYKFACMFADLTSTDWERWRQDKQERQERREAAKWITQG